MAFSNLQIDSQDTQAIIEDSQPTELFDLASSVSLSSSMRPVIGDTESFADLEDFDIGDPSASSIPIKEERPVKV